MYPPLLEVLLVGPVPDMRTPDALRCAPTRAEPILRTESVGPTTKGNVNPPFAAIPEVTGTDQSEAPLDVERRERTAPMILSSHLLVMQPDSVGTRLYSSIELTHFGEPRSK